MLVGKTIKWKSSFAVSMQNISIRFEWASIKIFKMLQHACVNTMHIKQCSRMSFTGRDVFGEM